MVKKILVGSIIIILSTLIIIFQNQINEINEKKENAVKYYREMGFSLIVIYEHEYEGGPTGVGVLYSKIRKYSDIYINGLFEKRIEGIYPNFDVNCRPGTRIYANEYGAISDMKNAKYGFCKYNFQPHES